MTTLPIDIAVLVFMNCALHSYDSVTCINTTKIRSWAL